MKLDLYEIAEVLAAKNDVSQFENVTFRNAEFDSRLIEAGDLFIPLKGARYHDSLRSGCCGYLV